MTSPGCFRRPFTHSAAHLRRMCPIFAGVVRTTPDFFTPKRCPGLGAATGAAGRENARKSIIFGGSSPGDSAVADYGDRNGSQTVFRCPLITQNCGKARADLQTATKRSKKHEVWFFCSCICPRTEFLCPLSSDSGAQFDTLARSPPAPYITCFPQ